MKTKKKRWSNFSLFKDVKKHSKTKKILQTQFTTNCTIFWHRSDEAFNFVCMINSKWLYWTAQLVGWVSYAALLFLATYADDPKGVDIHLIINILSLVFFAILGTHIMRSAFFRFGWLELKLTPLLPRVFIASIICSVFIIASTTIIRVIVDENAKNDL